MEARNILFCHMQVTTIQLTKKRWKSTKTRKPMALQQDTSNTVQLPRGDENKTSIICTKNRFLTPQSRIDTKQPMSSRKY